MGCCKSKDIISTILINSNEINISNFEFKENLKSKLSLIEEPNGFNCFVDFIFEIKTRGLYPINNNKLVSYNNNNLQFLTKKNAILEYNFKNQLFKLINNIISEINNENLININDKNFFLNICEYIYNHRNFIQMV